MTKLVIKTCDHTHAAYLLKLVLDIAESRNGFFKISRVNLSHESGTVTISGDIGVVTAWQAVIIEELKKLKEIKIEPLLTSAKEAQITEE